jgi:hypothetical protein
MTAAATRGSAARTWYATVPADTLRFGVPHGQPVMLSLASFTTWRPRWEYMPALPEADLSQHEVAVDSGGFMAMKHGGYAYCMRDYARWLSAVQPTWAALPDLCNEPQIAPLPENRHIRVFSSFATGMMLWQHLQDAAWAWVPTVQGYDVSEYALSAHLLRPQIERMQEAYYGARWSGDPTAFDAIPDPYLRQVRDDCLKAPAPTERHARGFRVGIGSLCVRKDAHWMERVDAIIEAVAEALPGEFGFHLWGISLNYLKTRQGRLHPRVVSTDSSAFNGRFGPDIQRLEARQASTCRACLRWYIPPPEQPRCPMCGGAFGLGQREFAMRVRLPEYAAKAQRYLAVRQQRLPIRGAPLTP